MASTDKKPAATSAINERYSTLEVDHSSDLPEATGKSFDRAAYKNDGSNAPEVVQSSQPPSMLSPGAAASQSDPRYSYASTPGQSTGAPSDARFSCASTPYAPLATSSPPANGPPTALEQGDAGMKSAFDHPRAKRKICGIPRRTFLLCLGIVLVFIVAAAVGGGVGGVLGSRHASDSSDSNDGETGSGSGNSSVQTTTRLMTGSNLAAINYTDGSGVQRHRVYYQTASLDLAAAEWDGTSGNWSSAQIVSLGSGNDVQAKNGTPIAAYVFWRANGQHSFHLSFLDPSNLVRAYISSISSPTNWTLSSADSLVHATPDSSLAAYGTGCSICLDGAHFLLYQDNSSAINVLAMQNISSTSSSFTYNNEKSASYNAPLTILPSGSGAAVPGSALATVPIFPVQGNEPKAAVYANVAGLQEIYFIPSDSPQWQPLSSISSSSSASAALSPTAGIAAFARDVNDTLEIAVLTSKSGGGVAATYWDGTAANWGRTASVQGMSGVDQNSVLVASQAGRVYGYANGQLVEWKFNGGPGQDNAAGADKWERVGVVPVQ
ncbi:hypothetical protein IWZ01DRAFT_25919 [Phyllosticta capitalensis]